VPVAFPTGFETNVRRFLDWFLDLLGVSVAGPEVADLFVHYSGGAGDLLVPLLSSVFESLNRSSGISAELVFAAAQSDRFIKAGADALLARLGGDVEGRAALAAAVLASGRLGDAVALDLIVFACEQIAGCPAPSNLAALLTRLTDLGLLVRGPTENSYTLPAVGIGPVLAETFMEAGAIEAIRQAWGTSNVGTHSQ
jgi:hypothetical protein